MRSVAIVVGIDVYPPKCAQPNLGGAVADACDFADWALDVQGGNVSPSDLYFWTHPWPQHATGRLRQYLQHPTEDWETEGSVAPDVKRPPKAEEIVQTALVLAERFKLAKQGGDPETYRIYIFLAGHGVRTREIGSSVSQTFFVASNFKGLAGLAYGLAPGESLRLALLANGFDQVLMFLDCCRVQDNVLPLQSAIICGAIDAEQPNLPWGIGHAAQDGYVAWETATPPIRGVFSQALLQGLRTHRDPTTSELDVQTLHNYLLNDASLKARQQVPSFNYNPNPPGPVIVKGGGQPHPDLILDLSNLPPGTMLRLTDGNFQPIPGRDPFAAIAGLHTIPSLPAGLYSVESVDGSVEPFDLRHPSKDPPIVT